MSFRVIKILISFLLSVSVTVQLQTDTEPVQNQNQEQAAYNTAHVHYTKTQNQTVCCDVCVCVFLPQSETGWTRWVRYPWRDSAAPEQHKQTRTVISFSVQQATEQFWQKSSTDEVFKQQWSKYLPTPGVNPRLHLQMGLILFSTFLVQPIGRFPTNTVLFVFTFSSAFLLLSFCLFSTHFSTSFSPSGSRAFLFFFFAGVSFPRSSSSAFSKLISLQEKKKNDPCYSRTKDN